MGVTWGPTDYFSHLRMHIDGWHAQFPAWKPDNKLVFEPSADSRLGYKNDALTHRGKTPDRPRTGLHHRFRATRLQKLKIARARCGGGRVLSYLQAPGKHENLRLKRGNRLCAAKRK